MRANSLAAELKTLFWLQWKLTWAMFRSRRLMDKAQILQLLLQILQVVFTFPFFVAMGIGVAVGLALVSPAAAFELAVTGNTFIAFLWLLLPASYSSQLMERFEMSRLFMFPISFRGLLIGSTLMSCLTMTGFFTLPLLLGEIVGLAWHAPLALPLIVLGALPLFALLILSGRIIEDIFDLVAGDRRLRAIAITLLTLPFMFLWIGQYIVQFFVNRSGPPPDFLLPLVSQLERATSFSQIIEILRPSRLLLWLPPGWATAGMGLALKGEWLAALGFLALTLGFVGGLLWLHARVTQRLMEGAALSIGVERIKTRRLRLPLSGPAAFWTLVHKDWLHLSRNPLPRSLFFSSIIMVLIMGFSFASIPINEFPEEIRPYFPLLAAGGIILLLNMTTSMALLGNYFGVIDREGFSTLALSGVDRRMVLLASALTTSIFSMAQYLAILVVATLISRVWLILPLGLLCAFCLQVSSAPLYQLAAILGPYRMQLKFTNQRQGGNLWGMLAWLISLPPMALLIVLPYILWRPALYITLPLALIYSVGLYTLTLKPLAQLLQKHEHIILEAITREV